MTAQSLTQDPPPAVVPECCGIAESLRDSGSVHIKQAIDDTDVQLFRGLFDDCMHQIMSPDADWDDSLDRTALINFIKTCGNFKLITSSVLGFPLHDIVGAVFSSSVLGAYCDYLESDEVAVSFEFAFARLAHPERSLSDSPFHQDSLAVCADLIVNTWVTLDNAGDAASGLEIVRQRVHDIYAPTDDARTNHALAELDTQSVERLFGDHLWRPVCAPGDALAFDGRTIHRTWKTEDMTQSRRSLEFRTMAAHRMTDMWRTHPHAIFNRQGDVLSVFVGSSE